MIEHYADRTVLITGGTGFIGNALVNALSKIPCRIIVLLRPGRKWEAAKFGLAEVIPVRGDIREGSTWAAHLGDVDYVFHLAAQTSAYVANQDPLADLQASLVPILQMLETCHKNGLRPTILFAGTATQVGSPSVAPVNEKTQDLPVTVYDIHKLAMEKYLQHYSRNMGIVTSTLRLANVYGPGSNVGSSDRGVLNLMIKKGLDGQTLTIYGDGARFRDYIFIDDVISAFLVAGEWAQKLNGKYYLIGSEQGYRIADAFNLVADRIQHSLGFRPPVAHIPPPLTSSAIEDRDFIADSDLFRAATGWNPEVTLSDGIDRTIKYYLAQR